MPARLRDRPLVRGAAALVSGCALAMVLLAAEPVPRLDELDEVVVYAVKPKPIPLIDFLDFPRFDSVVISPGGTHIATGWGEDNFERRVNVADFPSMKPRSTGLMQIYFGVTDLRWVDENRLLLQPTWPLIGLRRIREHLGTLMILDVDGHTLHELFPAPSGTPNQFEYQHAQEELAKQTEKIKDLSAYRPYAFGPLRAVTARADASDQILFQTLWLEKDFEPGGYGAFSLDLQPGNHIGIRLVKGVEVRGSAEGNVTRKSSVAAAAFPLLSGTQTRVARLPMRGGQVITGAGQRSTLVAGVNEAGEELVYYLPEAARAEGKDWKLLVRSASGARGLRPLVWTGQGENYYALDGRDMPRRAVVIWNAISNTQTLLYRHPDADMDVVWQDPSGKPWMYSGNSRKPVYWYPDPAHPLAQLHSLLSRHVAPEIVEVLNATDDLSKAVVRVSSGRRPPVFMVLDVRKAASIVGMPTYPKLKISKLAEVKDIEFPARDGLAIRGFLTTPLEIDGTPRRGLPLIVISHAGPRGEVADARYDFERQLFASRGYAVLQVNARGSAGRGAAFEQAGDGKWGREVQDDFADGVRWAIKDGVAAPDSACFFGTGYGAYSALIAAAREPNLFQCVIGVGGVYDLPLLVAGEGEPTEVQKEIPLAMRRAFGADTEELRQRSPVAVASSIKAQVFLMHQDEDKKEPESQINSMKRALRSAGNPAKSQTIGTGDRGYFTPDTRVTVYATMLRFLEQQIGGKRKVDYSH